MSACEICDDGDIKKCRWCSLSGEPNPEAFTRGELVYSLIRSHKPPFIVGVPYNLMFKFIAAAFAFGVSLGVIIMKVAFH